MEQARIEASIDELYAIQKQAGDRLVELTRENQLILEQLEKEVSMRIGELIRYSKMYIIVNLLIIAALLFLFYSCNKSLTNKLEALEVMTRRSSYAALGILGELEKQGGEKNKVVDTKGTKTVAGKKK